ncbi:intraflagellar transport 88-like protein isoform X2 [Micractinium conductrix]|uniref:Intraflagellar transport 88-like protein isoform X2 n=1 Tax=Micractinium conductrix TaxID=554055 RepID=A0A2P6VR61_9CHLO|nr:intraflagellar transport 88-like protein isoform X2 [Micractinium conductrix]|eukprot:PSC76555.1 intraflagellar transport 88-like protein isoform X2 [Micractinium conductrix]
MLAAVLMRKAQLPEKHCEVSPHTDKAFSKIAGVAADANRQKTEEIMSELPYSALHRPGAAGFGTRTATGTKGVKPLTDAGRAAKAATALGASGFHRCEPSKMPVPAGLPSTQKRVSSRLGRSGAATGTGKLQMQ